MPFAGYYAAVSALDDNVGRLVKALDELGLREKTIIVYYSDHGDTFLYRGPGHKFTCHEDSIKVPLIISWPGSIAEGLVVDQMVGLQDLMPTILDWAELGIPDYLHGQSITPLLAGASVPWREAHYTQNITHDTAVDQRCIRTKAWKLILSRPSPSLRRYMADHALYDLVNDPEEELNLYDTPRESEHNQFRHLPSYTDTIIELARLLKRYAAEIDDQLGCDLADLCLVDMQKRKERDAV